MVPRVVPSDHPSEHMPTDNLSDGRQFLLLRIICSTMMTSAVVLTTTMWDLPIRPIHRYWNSRYQYCLLPSNWPVFDCRVRMRRSVRISYVVIPYEYMPCRWHPISPPSHPTPPWPIVDCWVQIASHTTVREMQTTISILWSAVVVSSTNKRVWRSRSRFRRRNRQANNRRRVKRYKIQVRNRIGCCWVARTEQHNPMMIFLQVMPRLYSYMYLMMPIISLRRTRIWCRRVPW